MGKDAIQLFHVGPFTWIHKLLDTVAHLSSQHLQWSSLATLKDASSRVREAKVMFKKDKVLLTDPFTIALFICSDALTRRGTKKEESQVVQWMNFSHSEILSAQHVTVNDTRSKWSHRPIEENPHVYIKDNYVALDHYLKTRSYLIGNHLSLADLIIAWSMFSLPLHPKLVPGLNNIKKWLKLVRATSGAPSQCTTINVDGAINVQRRLRILCLHGYHQNAQMFHEKIGGLRKIWKKSIDFHYMEAPHLIPNEKTDDPSTFGWWLHPRTESSTEDRQSRFLEQLDKSLKSLDEKIESRGPFDGLLSFSQGSCFAILHCLFNLEKKHKLFPFYVFVAAFLPRRFEHPEFVAKVEKADVKSLHVMGEKDAIIDIDLSLKATEKFRDPLIIKHSMGHLVPTKSAVALQMLQFINKHQH